MRLAIAAMLAVASLAPITGSAQPHHHPVPPNQVCDPSPYGDTLHCRLTVEFKSGQWTTEPIVWFDAPRNVKIVWKMKHRTFGIRYGFRNDSLIVPANVTGFKDPCSSDDDDNCPAADGWHARFRWLLVDPGPQQFDYQLKLYPEDASLSPIIVKVKAMDKPADDRDGKKPKRKKKGPVWVDPTIVIQG